MKTLNYACNKSVVGSIVNKDIREFLKDAGNSKLLFRGLLFDKSMVLSKDKGISVLFDDIGKVVEYDTCTIHVNDEGRLNGGDAQFKAFEDNGWTYAGKFPRVLDIRGNVDSYDLIFYKITN